MSSRDFEKDLLKNLVLYLPASEQKRKLIVISDNKGFSLERCRDSETEKSIKFDSR